MYCTCGYIKSTQVYIGSPGAVATPAKMYLQQTQRHLSSKMLSSSRLLVQQQQQQQQRQQQKRCATKRGQPAQILAMINVDGSPPLFLGAGMIAAGAILYQLRNSRPYITKDFDIVLSCIAIFAGGILVFQGWRLDPILLFGQLLTAGAALSFAVEALRLREVVHKKELSEAADYERQAMDSRYDAQAPESLSLPARWDDGNRMQAEAQTSRPWWEEPQPTYRPSQYEQNPNGAGSSVQNNMDSQIPPDSADRQRNMASSNSAAASQFQQQPNSPQSNQSSQRGATPQWSQQQQRWGSDVDLGSLEEWDSD